LEGTYQGAAYTNVLTSYKHLHSSAEYPARTETKKKLVIKDFENHFGKKIDVGQRFQFASMVSSGMKVQLSVPYPFKKICKKSCEANTEHE
jgi:hypothetical protein